MNLNSWLYSTNGIPAQHNAAGMPLQKPHSQLDAPLGVDIIPIPKSPEQVQAELAALAAKQAEVEQRKIQERADHGLPIPRHHTVHAEAQALREAAGLHQPPVRNPYQDPQQDSFFDVDAAGTPLRNMQPVLTQPQSGARLALTLEEVRRAMRAPLPEPTQTQQPYPTMPPPPQMPDRPVLGQQGQDPSKTAAPPNLSYGAFPIAGQVGR